MATQTHYFNPAQSSTTIQTILSAMSAGDVGVWTPGTYTLTSGGASGNGSYCPVNNTFMMGMPGAILTLGANVDAFQIANNGSGAAGYGANTTGIYISGFTFLANGSFAPASAYVFLVNALNATCVGNTFSGFNGTETCVIGFQGEGTRVDNNTFNNTYQPISFGNGSSATALNGLSICNNQINGVKRIAIEVHDNGTFGGYDHFHCNNNTIYNVVNDPAVSGSGIVLSFVTLLANAPSGDFTCIGNKIFGLSPLAIEIAYSGTCAFNEITNYATAAQSGTVGISNCGTKGCYFYGNSFRSPVNNGDPFGKDGGWVQSQWIGDNIVNGSVVTGSTTIGANLGTMTPPTFAPTTLAGMLNLLRDSQAAGSIVPLRIRDIVGSIPIGSPASPWNVYP